MPYSNQYTQPRSSPGRYDLNAQALYSQWPNSTCKLNCSFHFLCASFSHLIRLILAPQISSAFPNYETHERYSTQPSYTTYPSRSTPPIHSNPTDSRRLPPLATSSPNLGGERWQQSYGMAAAPNYPGNTIRSPTASYPNAYVAYSNSNQASAYGYHVSSQDHMTMNPHGHNVMFEDIEASHPRSTSPYSRGSSQVSPPNFTPPPISPTSPEEPTVKKKRKRADAAQLKVLNETYNRTAFPSTEERQTLAKMLDMSARSVQIWSSSSSLLFYCC